MRLIPMTCPRCDANLDTEHDDNVKFCKYCGVPIYFDDGRKTKTIIKHYIDEAKVQSVFSKERLTMHARKGKALAILLGILFYACLMGMSVYSSAQAKAEKNERIAQGYVEAPYSASSAKDKDYQNIETAFKKAGFKNVRTEGKGDLWLGILEEDGTVIEVSIDGQTSFSRGDLFLPDAEVRVVYHSF